MALGAKEGLRRCANLQIQWFERFARREGIADAVLGETVACAEEGQIDADLGGGVIKQRIARPTNINDDEQEQFKEAAKYTYDFGGNSAHALVVERTVVGYSALTMSAERSKILINGPYQFRIPGNTAVLTGISSLPTRSI
jgi:hypothetical protein